MKSQYRNYIFLLSIIVLALFGGFFFKSYDEAFSIKEAYNSSSRKIRNKIIHPFKESMFAHYHNFNLFGRKNF